MGLPRAYLPVLMRQVGGKRTISRSDHGYPPSRNPLKYRWMCLYRPPVACCHIREMQVSRTPEAARGDLTEMMEIEMR